MRLAPTLTALLALSAAPAKAQDLTRASQALQISATAQSACVIRGASVTEVQNAAFTPLDAANGQITITRLVDPQTAQPQASMAAISLPVTCNAAHRVSVASSQGGLLRPGGSRTATGAFSDFLPYRIALDWAGGRAEQGSEGGILAIDAANGRNGDLSLRVTTPQGGTPLAAGAYDDAIVIQFQPAS